MNPGEIFKEFNEVLPTYIDALKNKFVLESDEYKIIDSTELLEFTYFGFYFVIKSNPNVFNKNIILTTIELTDSPDIFGEKLKNTVNEVSIAFKYSNGMSPQLMAEFNIHKPDRLYNRDQADDFASKYGEILYEYLKVEKSK